MCYNEQIFITGSTSATHRIKAKLTQAGKWFWKHKKWIIITAFGTAGVIIVVKNRSAIKEFLHTFSRDDPIVKPMAEKKIPSIPIDVLEARTGVMLTATKLGNKVGMSNREINKRLIKAGLAFRLPCGELELTDDGKLLGKASWKVTPWNKTIPLIQWDESVLKIIFSPEELAEIAEQQRQIQNILTKTSA